MAAPVVQKKSSTQYVYPFGENGGTPSTLDRYLLGGKGKGLAEMASLGLPIPPGFIISTEACNAYRQNHRHFPEELELAVQKAIEEMERISGLQFGSESRPLLVSVRSGAPASMPGMMDTILNLGLNERSVVGFAEASENERLAYDCYRRLIMMYSEIVSGVDRLAYVEALEVIKRREGVNLDIEITVVGLKQACVMFKQIHQQRVGKPFPEDVHEQLFEAIKAVFNSWDSERALLYRKLNRIPDEWGTAVTVQKMVFGNKNNSSATGVGFSRDPSTGAPYFYGEFLPNAQGEEVVAGIRTPHPINKYQKEITHSQLESLEELMPEVYGQLCQIVKQLEKHYHNMQDVEFTVEDGKLWMLQTRNGKRTVFAAIRIACDMLQEGLIDEKAALKQIDPEQLIQLLAPVFDEKGKLAASEHLAAHGLNAGPGAASGKIALSKEKVIEMKARGEKAILVREETSPDDFPGMAAAEGILTLRGGSTSHAAVVARGMGKPCIVGCGTLQIDWLKKTVSSLEYPKLVLREGDIISLDGSTGEVFFCELLPTDSEIIQVIIDKTKPPEASALYQHYKKIMQLADKYRQLQVRANADTEVDCAVACEFGAEGIGLCRTEHMFLEVTRLNRVRCMLFSRHPEERKQAIRELLPHQKQDFAALFRVIRGLPITIRLLDPPLHEFMPHTDEELQTLALLMKSSQEQLAYVAASLEEQNPMLGHRGCRLGITYPDLTQMQTRAILEAAVEVFNEGIPVVLEIMVPLVCDEKEFEHQKMVIDKAAQEVFAEKGQAIPYSVGTMIELPRAALMAGEIAKEAQFFSFGTNDLTQTTFGISRDDGNKFVPLYVEGVPHPLNSEERLQILKEDPFQTIDQQGVGALMQIAMERGRQTRPTLKCGICGEHGGDPKSIQFFHRLGLNYVSCSPYRVPVARLSAALASLHE